MKFRALSVSDIFFDSSLEQQECVISDIVNYKDFLKL